MSSDAGAWGSTVATISQARVWRAVGAERIVLANELVEPGSARWVAGELNRDADFEVFCLVDSVAGVAILDASLEQAGLVRPLKVFIEVGFQGGRTGCRSAGEARSVAGAVAGSRNLALAGVESFEGIIDKASPKRPSGRWTICSPKCGAVVAGLDAAGYFSDTEPLQDALEVWGRSALAAGARALAARLRQAGRPVRPRSAGAPAGDARRRGRASARRRSFGLCSQ
jgi:Alanine racemase, N-terminal domain